MGPYNSLICTGEKEAVRILTFLLFLLVDMESLTLMSLPT